MNPPEESRRDRFDAWLRGELDEDGARRFLDEARADPELAAEVSAHEELLAALRSLPREIEPERDLWPQIAARARTGRSRGRATWLAAGLAAGVLLAVAVSFVAQRMVEPPLVAMRPAPTLAPRGVPALAAYAETDRELTAIGEQLRREVEAVAGGLPPETRAVVFENLRTIDRAIEEIEAALVDQPDDPELARTYVAYRQQQIDLLRRVNRAASRL